MTDSFILKGDIVYSRSADELVCCPDSYLVCENGLCQGVFDRVPEQFSSLEVRDHTGCLIIPGMSDMHVHASQYQYYGTGFDYQLIEWLEKNAFPNEARLADEDYAEKAYDLFVNALLKTTTTRSVCFASIHVPATEILMRKMNDSGMVSYVGKVNMDRNCPDYIRETAEQSARDTEQWIIDTIDKYSNCHPIITPRFTVSCSDELMRALGEITEKYHLPVQSHLSENTEEIELIRQLCPWADYYAETYSKPGLMPQNRTIMDHCIYSSDEELKLLKERGVNIVHCPESNVSVIAGIAPVSRYLKEGLRVSLGSDIAGGSVLSIFQAMKMALIESKIRWLYIDSNHAPLRFAQVFYMATMGGGEFFGRCGSFMDGYEFDAVVIDDGELATLNELDPVKRLERITFVSSERQNIISKYCQGRKIL